MAGKCARLCKTHHLVFWELAVPYISYVATKAAIIQFTRVIALQYARSGIRANSILPGMMNTPMVHAAEVIAAYGGSAEEMVRRRAHGRCLGCRVRGAVPRLRRGQVHYRHRTGCRWRAYGELRLRRVTPNAKGRRRTAVATATFASAGMVGPPARPPARPRARCDFGENSHRDSIWEIPLNSSRVLDSGRHGTKRITVNNREEGRDGSLPHRPLRQC